MIQQLSQSKKILQTVQQQKPPLVEHVTSLENLMQTCIEEQLNEFKEYRNLSKEHNILPIYSSCSSCIPNLSDQAKQYFKENQEILEKLNSYIDKFLEYLLSKQTIEYSIDSKENKGNNILTSYFTYFQKRSKYLRQPQRINNQFQLQFNQTPHKLRKDFQFLQLKRKTQERNIQAYNIFLQRKISQLRQELNEFTGKNQIQNSNKNRSKEQNQNKITELALKNQDNSKNKEHQCNEIKKVQEQKVQPSKTSEPSRLDCSTFKFISQLSNSKNSTQLKLAKFSLEVKEKHPNKVYFGFQNNEQLDTKMVDQNGNKAELNMRHSLREFQKYQMYKVNKFDKYLFLNERAAIIQDVTKLSKNKSKKNKQQEQQNVDSIQMQDTNIIETEIQQLDTKQATYNDKNPLKMEVEDEVNSKDIRANHMRFYTESIKSQKDTFEFEINQNLSQLKNLKNNQEFMQIEQQLNKQNGLPLNQTKVYDMEIEYIQPNIKNENKKRKEDSNQQLQKMEFPQSLSLSVYFNMFYINLNNISEQMEIEIKDKQKKKLNIQEDFKSLIIQIFKSQLSNKKINLNSNSGLKLEFNPKKNKQLRRIGQYGQLQERYYRLSKKRLFDMASPHKHFKVKNQSIDYLELVKFEYDYKDDNKNKIIQPMHNIDSIILRKQVLATPSPSAINVPVQIINKTEPPKTIASTKRKSKVSKGSAGTTIQKYNQFIQTKIKDFFFNTPQQTSASYSSQTSSSQLLKKKLSQSNNTNGQEQKIEEKQNEKNNKKNLFQRYSDIKYQYNQIEMGNNSSSNHKQNLNKYQKDNNSYQIVNSNSQNPNQFENQYSLQKINNLKKVQQGQFDNTVSLQQTEPAYKVRDYIISEQQNTKQKQEMLKSNLLTTSNSIDKTKLLSNEQNSNVKKVLKYDDLLEVSFSKKSLSQSKNYFTEQLNSTTLIDNRKMNENLNNKCSSQIYTYSDNQQNHNLFDLLSQTKLLKNENNINNHYQIDKYPIPSNQQISFSQKQSYDDGRFTFQNKNNFLDQNQGQNYSHLLNSFNVQSDNMKSSIFFENKINENIQCNLDSYNKNPTNTIAEKIIQKQKQKNIIGETKSNTYLSSIDLINPQQDQIKEKIDPSVKLYELLQNFSCKNRAQKDNQKNGIGVGYFGDSSIMQNKQINSILNDQKVYRFLQLDHQFFLQQKSQMEMIREVWKQICKNYMENEEVIKVIIDFSSFDSFSQLIFRQNILKTIFSLSFYFRLIDKTVLFEFKNDQKQSNI